MNLWKLNIKTAHEEGANPKTFCLERGIMGIGWPVQGLSENLSAEAYLQAARNRYASEKGKRMPGAINAMVYRVQINDLVWLRDDQNIFHLGRVTGPWQYISFDGRNDEWDKNDIHNYRKVEWHQIGLVDEIPWGVVKQFSRGTLTAIPDDDQQQLLNFSKFVYNHQGGQDQYPIDYQSGGNLFNYLDAKDCEDVVSLYLQEELGYCLLPSTCQANTKHYEFVLVHPKKNQRAVAQVKNGKASLYGSNYDRLIKEDGGIQVYLLTTQGSCSTDGRAHVTCLDASSLAEWIIARPGLWSGRIQRWVHMLHK